MSIVSTPHISAESDAFGKTVLMPGDPLRAKFIAENFLEDAVQVNSVRVRSVSWRSGAGRRVCAVCC